METLPVFDAPEGGQLSDAMLAAYDEAGVIILRNFVDPDTCDRLRARALELVDDFDPQSVRHVFSTLTQEQIDDSYFNESGDKIRFFLEDDAFDASGELRQTKENSLNKMGHAMHDLDPVFEAFSHSDELDVIARRLGLSDPGVIQSMYIFKPPRIGGEVICHQDSTFIYTEPETCIGFWFALEDATLENGCMHFIPGAHKKPLKQRHFRQADGSFQTVELDSTPWQEDRKLPAPAAKGDLVIFNGRAPHLSGANHSDKSRHAYTLHAIDRAAHYPAENWLQRSELPLRGFQTS
ncbi:MAG: phytanoyl-CoA dioxygenase family protein [Pseudomonadota bacterium]